jgi:hypothetical protein
MERSNPHDFAFEMDYQYMYLIYSRLISEIGLSFLFLFVLWRSLYLVSFVAVSEEIGDAVAAIG